MRYAESLCTVRYSTVRYIENYRQNYDRFSNMFEKLLLGKLSTRMKIYQHCDLHMIVPLGFMLYRDFTVINLNLFPFVIVIKHLLGSKVICNLVCSSEPYVNYSVSRRCKIKSLRIMKTRTNESSLGIRQFFL